MVGVICIVVSALLILYFFLTAGSAPGGRGDWLREYRFAHRGLHNEEFPENTLPAFLRAAERGYAIELDVRLSKDGEVMVFHDDELKRVTGQEGRVADCTAEELARMGACGTRHTIPRFTDVLREVGGKTPILIETKNEGGAGALEAALYELLRGYGGRYAVQSFSPFSIGWFKKNAPEVLRGQLSAHFTEGAEHIAAYKRFIIKSLLSNVFCRPNFISYERGGVADAEVRRLRKTGLPVLAWTVRNTRQEQQARQDADSVIFEQYLPGGEEETWQEK
ncbi:MAG TPA: glycerophosphodiester phosphodiesterase [Clostridiales bacterium]|nr:glycerophosphodiester phosphodiesterase [Clostridiales bacterium]